LVATATPAKPGEEIVLYATGLGATTPAAVNGQVQSAGATLVATPSVTIGGVAAKVVYAGVAGTGLFQINVIVPNPMPDGDAAIVCTAGSGSTPAGALLAVKN